MDGLSVPKRKWCGPGQNGKAKHKKAAKVSRDTERLQEEMSAYLAARVEIKPQKGRGNCHRYMDTTVDELLNKLQEGLKS